LRAAAEAARDAAYRDVRGTIAAPRYTAFVLQLGLWLENAGRRAEEAPGDTLPERIDGLAERLLQKRHKAVLKAGRHFAQLTPEERHALRIAVKKQRYAVDFFQSLYGGRRMRGYWKSLKRLQAALGHLNDAAVAMRLTDTLPNGDPELARGTGLLLGWHGHAAARLQSEILADWEGFIETKPFWRGSKG
ncbi:MAG TPA: CHAD domain-containing protein, partial [Alphaproteobacteria bacterium]|nr:CHAD domain-containing protein [Alphaproteobacteria bacterium]